MGGVSAGAVSTAPGAVASVVAVDCTTSRDLAAGIEGVGAGVVKEAAEGEVARKKRLRQKKEGGGGGEGC